jgi:DICT domain-containing protein
VYDPFDPEPAQFTGESLLERVSRAYEEAVDAYGNACDDAALKENVYLAAHATAWVHAIEDGVAATVRDKHCKAQGNVCAALQDWNRALAAEKRSKAKVQEMNTRMTAAMSHQRMVREGT